MKWYWTVAPDEPWRNSFDGRDAAIADAKGMLDPGASFYIGWLKTYEPLCPSGEEILDILANAASDNPEYSGGEVSDGWLDGVSAESKDNLEERIKLVIAEWLSDNNLTPEFGAITDVEHLIA